MPTMSIFKHFSGLKQLILLRIIFCIFFFTEDLLKGELQAIFF